MYAVARVVSYFACGSTESTALPKAKNADRVSPDNDTRYAVPECGSCAAVLILPLNVVFALAERNNDIQIK